MLLSTISGLCRTQNFHVGPQVIPDSIPTPVDGEVTNVILKKEGIYVAYRANPSELLEYLAIGADFGNNTKTFDELHVTVMYAPNSSIGLMELMTTIGIAPAEIRARVTGFKVLGADDNMAAVALLESPELVQIHNSLKEAGLKPSYAEYQPHITMLSHVNKETAEHAVKLMNDAFNASAMKDNTYVRVFTPYYENLK